MAKLPLYIHKVTTSINAAPKPPTPNPLPQRPAAASPKISTSKKSALGCLLSAAFKRTSTTSKTSIDVARKGDTDAAKPQSPAGTTASNRLRPQDAGEIGGFAVPSGIIAGRQKSPNGIYQVDNRFFINHADASGKDKTYEIRSDFKSSDNHVNIIDPETRKSVAIAHSTGNGTWKPSGLKGGISRVPYPTGTGHWNIPAPTKYQMPMTLERWVALGGLDEEWQEMLHEKRQRLKNDSADFMKTVRSQMNAQGARAYVPTFDDGVEISPEQLIRSSLKTSDGIVIGERHDQFDAVDFLDRNMGLFSDEGVETLYLEGLIHEADQKGLDASFENQTPYSSQVSKYDRIIEKAHSNGIRVKCLDTNASYVKALAKVAETGVIVKNGRVINDSVTSRATQERLATMNMYGAGVISQNEGKWVALVGKYHLTSSPLPGTLLETWKPVPGLADVTKAVAIDISPGASGASVQRSPQDHYGDFILNPEAPQMQDPVLPNLSAGDLAHGGIMETGADADVRDFMLDPAAPEVHETTLPHLSAEDLAHEGILEAGDDANLQDLESETSVFGQAIQAGRSESPQGSHGPSREMTPNNLPPASSPDVQAAMKRMFEQTIASKGQKRAQAKQRDKELEAFSAKRMRTEADALQARQEQRYQAERNTHQTLTAQQEAGRAARKEAERQLTLGELHQAAKIATAQERTTRAQPAALSNSGPSAADRQSQEEAINKLLAKAPKLSHDIPANREGNTPPPDTTDDQLKDRLLRLRLPDVPKDPIATPAPGKKSRAALAEKLDSNGKSATVTRSR